MCYKLLASMGLFESCVVLYVITKNVAYLHVMQMSKMWLDKDTGSMQDVCMLFQDQNLLSGEE